MGSCLKSTLIFISDIYFLFVSVLFWFLNVFRKRRIVTKPDDGLLLISATQAAEMIRRKEITSSDLLEAYIKRIEQVNGIINAVVVKDYTCARHTAAEIDAVLAKLTDDSDEYNELITAKPLLGVPFTVKDCIEVNGLACTAGLSCRKGTKAVKDAVVIERMRNSGAIILAVTNVPEVCMWWESFNSIYGRSSNPYDSRRITGGSSGGEAALISSAGSVVGIGSDIGGSIRMPSYFNGVFGLKPTPGIVPLDGHLPEPVGYRTEMLRIGPICRYAEDLTVMLKVLADNDGLSRILGNPVDLHGLRVFYMKGLKTPLVQPLSSDCENALRRAVQYFEMKYDLCAYGLDLPIAHHAVELFATSMDVPEAPSFANYMTDLKSELNCFTELAKWIVGQSPHTLPAIVLGMIDGNATFNEDQKKMFLAYRQRLVRQLSQLLADDGVLIFPSFPTVAPYHHQPLLTPLNFAYTALWNAVAFPVVECPMGLNSQGVPLGVQVVGAPGSDHLLIAVAQDLEDGFGGWKPLIR